MTTAAIAAERQTMYLDPLMLIPHDANTEARPAETSERRKLRVESMIESIKEFGQMHPVLVADMLDGTYQYLDGGCRVEAITQINETEGSNVEVWCSVADTFEVGHDPYRIAARANIDREQTSVLDKALLIERAIKRMEWAERGANKKAAAYFGFSEPRVSELRKVANAPADVKKRIEMGEIGSIDVALALLSTAGGEVERSQVADLAKKIAANRAYSLQPDGIYVTDGDEITKVPVEVVQVVQGDASKKKTSVTRSDVEQAKKEISGDTRRTLKDVVAWAEQISPVAYGAKAVGFSMALEAFIKGVAEEKVLTGAFDSLCKSGDNKVVVKSVKVKAEKKADKKVTAVKVEKKVVATKKVATKPVKKSAKGKK